MVETTEKRRTRRRKILLPSEVNIGARCFLYQCLVSVSSALLFPKVMFSCVHFFIAATQKTHLNHKDTESRRTTDSILDQFPVLRISVSPRLCGECLCLFRLRRPAAGLREPETQGERIYPLSVLGRALRGAFVGGGVRYQSPSFNQRNPTTGETYYGHKVLLANLLLGYRTRLTRDFLGRRPNVSVQLNIGNLFDRDQALPGRLNDLYNGPRRVYLQEPRSFRMSFGVEL
jgi:hypothetical protein